MAGAFAKAIPDLGLIDENRRPPVVAVADPQARDTAPLQGVQPDPNEQTKNLAPEGEAEPEEGMIRTLAEMAEVFEMETDDFLGELAIEEGGPSLAEVLTSYRAQPDAAAVAQQRDTLAAEFDVKATEMGAMYDEAMTGAGRLTQLLTDQLAGGVLSDAALATIQATDPDRFLQAQNQQLQAKQTLTAAMSELTAASTRRAEDTARQDKDLRDREMRKVAESWPELTDPVTGPAVNQEMRSYLGGIGFLSADIDGLGNDHRIYRVVRDGLELSKLKKDGSAAIAAAKTKGLRKPKAAPSARGEIKSRKGVSDDRLLTLKNKGRQTGSVDDAADYFQEMIGL